MADSPKDLQFWEMKDTITELNKLIKTLRETIEMMKAQQEQVSQEEAFATEAPADKTAHKSRKNNADRFKGIPVERCYLDVPEEERICRICGTPLEKIGEEFVRREIQFTRPKVKILEYYSVNYGCPSCKKNADLPCIVKGKE